VRAVFDGRGPNRGERGPPARIGDDLAALALPFHQPGMVQRGDAHRVFGQAVWIASWKKPPRAAL
jgi:hypothetical protein